MNIIYKRKVMAKVIGIILIVLFISSGALAYNNGNLTLSLQGAKESVINGFNTLVRFAEENK